MALREVQIALDRVQNLERVTGYICMTSSGRHFEIDIYLHIEFFPLCVFSLKKKGIPIRSTFNEEYTNSLVTQLQPFLDRIKRTINHIGFKDVAELRLKTKNLEYLLRTDNSCTFIVVQRHEKIINRTDEL